MSRILRATASHFGCALARHRASPRLPASGLAKRSRAFATASSGALRGGEWDAHRDESSSWAERFDGHLVPLRPIRGHTRGGPREITVYIKGFLGKHERPGDFEGWLDSHHHTHWRGDVAGWKWSSGGIFSLDEYVPMPVLTIAGLLTRRMAATPQSLAAATAADAAFTSARLYLQYYNACRSAEKEASILAEFLESVRSTHGVVRVVAHSMGCRLLLHTLARQAESGVDFRPDHVHLCAPAVQESDVSTVLGGEFLARKSARLYYTPRDMVLATLFQLIERGQAMGLTGARGEYPGLIQKEVGEFFGRNAHSEYEKAFHKFFEEHESL